MAKLLNIGEISFVLYLYGVFHENIKGLTSMNILSLFLFGRAALGLPITVTIIDNRQLSDLQFSIGLKNHRIFNIGLSTAPFHIR